MRLDSSTAAGQALLLTDQHITQLQVDCRRVQIMQYFGERFDKAACKGTCDNCRDSRPTETLDLTALARDAIR